jgi:hypothetical protein
MARIFLNYRRGDAAGSARRLFDELAARYGAHEIFFDDGSIESGAHFHEIEIEAVRSVDVFLALIGPDWFQRGPTGRRRIDDPDDHVRLEIKAALTSDIRVIPVLVDGATMPRPEELPVELRQLAFRKELVISGPAWQSGVAKLVRVLDAFDAPPAPAELAEPAAPRFPNRPLSSMLREAALAGVVPGSTVAAPSAPAEPPVKEAFPGAPAGTRALGGLRILVPLALLGAGVVVAKWLLGWFVQPVELAESSGDTVECTVFAPPSAAPGESILIQAFAHLPEQANDARAIAMELDADARRRTFQSLEAPVPHGGRLHFELRMPGLEVDDPVASLIWRRRAEAVQFGVRVPRAAADGAVIGTLEVSLDSAPVGHVKFKLAVDRHAAEAPSEPQGERARRYRAAFISYASSDREKVLARVQMLSIVGIRYFQDLLSLEPGDRWEKKLELGIDECDLFLLFWSSESKQSEWVRRETRYALDRRGKNELSPPEIRPVLLEGPPIVEPWEELAHLHFNDRLLYFMRPPDAA